MTDPKVIAFTKGTGGRTYEVVDFGDKPDALREMRLRVSWDEGRSYQNIQRVLVNNDLGYLDLLRRMVELATGDLQKKLAAQGEVRGSQ